jgi:WD40 repeat protein
MFSRNGDCTTGLEIQSWRAPRILTARSRFHPTGRSCVASGIEGDAVIRISATKVKGKQIWALRKALGPVILLTENVFAVASHLGYARVWDTATWRQEATLGGFLNGANSVAFSPDGKRLAIGSGDKEAVKLYDTESWQDVLTLESQGLTSGEASFSRTATPSAR